MTDQVSAIRARLCDAFCRDVGVWSCGDNVAISLPMTSRDGDHITVYAHMENGGWRVSDMGTTLMRLSYDHDLGKLLSGPREKLYTSTLAESGLAEDDGNIYIDVPADDLVHGLFVLGQGLSRIESLGLWTRSRVESTFYDDLRGVLAETVPPEEIEADYIVPNIQNASDYPVDFRITTPGRPLYLFGVNGRDKARLTTIILQYLMRHASPFDSMVVCQDSEELSRADRSRLMAAANDVVPNISDKETIAQKIAHRRIA